MFTTSICPQYINIYQQRDHILMIYEGWNQLDLLYLRKSLKVILTQSGKLMLNWYTLTNDDSTLDQRKKFHNTQQAND